MSLVNFNGSEATHMACITCFTSITTTKNDWIINSEAKDHITPYVDLLDEIKQLEFPYQVELADGNYVSVTHSGKCILNGKLTFLMSYQTSSSI